jgi:hypothetical protein
MFLGGTPGSCPAPESSDLFRRRTRPAVRAAQRRSDGRLCSSHESALGRYAGRHAPGLCGRGLGSSPRARRQPSRSGARAAGAWTAALGPRPDSRRQRVRSAADQNPQGR